MGCVEKYGIWESCKRLFQKKNYDGVDTGGNGGDKGKWMDLGCDLEGELTGAPSGFVMG